MKYSANLNVAPIGNGRIAALVTPQGRIAWWCFPRLDSDPVFSNLISGDEEKGFCDVLLGGAKQATSGYVRNTAIHESVLEDGNGNAVRITDFASCALSAPSIRPKSFVASSRYGACRA